VIIKAPMPKKGKHILVLRRTLENFKGKAVMENCFLSLKELSEFKADADLFKKRVLASAFLDFCRTSKPKEVVILNADCLSPAFFSAIAPYVGKIYLPRENENDPLCRSLLSNFGTPIIFSEGAGPTLCLGRHPTFASAVPIFSFNCFKNCSYNFDGVLPQAYKKVNPLVLSAVMHLCGGKNKVFEFWKNLVFKENMIYNNYDLN